MPPSFNDEPVDMSLSPSERANMAAPAVAGLGDMPKYPWGLTIRLDQDALKKLGIDELPEVGKLCQLAGIGRVVSVSQRENERGGSKDVEIQIERLNLEHEDSEAAFEEGAKKVRKNFGGGRGGDTY